MKKNICVSKINKILVLLAIFAVNGNLLQAEEFLYKHRAGDRYRIISTVNQDVYNGYLLSHKAEILNRITVDVISESEGKGYHKLLFQTSEKATGTGEIFGEDGVYQWTSEYESEFTRDPLGRLTIDKKYFMPVVRDVPVFPGRDLQAGDKWNHEGHEVHDFSANFGIAEPYRIPFTANYIFLGDREWKGAAYPSFSVSYRVETSPEAVPGKIWPKKISGWSDQIVYWDRDLGQPVAYTESFRYVFGLSNGKSVEFRGTAEAEIVEAERMDKERLAEEIAEEIERLNIPDVSVRIADEGIIISLDDIKFYPDSDVMLPGEIEKLDKIVAILKLCQERDILVGGHTALAGSAAGRERISLERASAVAGYLISKEARTPDRVVVRGYGASRPVADNRSEEGMRKNRRVEITILEN